MSSNPVEEYKQELVNHLSDAVKQVQIEFMSNTGLNESSRTASVISNNSPAGRILFSCLDMIFSHGLKNKEAGLWQAVQYFCRHDVVVRINRLPSVRSSKGKSRAWIYLALNEKELEGYLQSFIMDLPHMFKYYSRSALICSSQVPLLQTLISGLDCVTFDLDLNVSYLNFSIMCKKEWNKNQPNPHKYTHDRGSTVHINTESISRAGQKAVGIVKGILSQESSSSSSLRSKSMENIDTARTLVAVNSSQITIQSRSYCPDCGSQSELICLCVAKKPDEAAVTATSKNAMLLQRLFDSTDNTADGRLRFNPFDKSSHQQDEIELPTIGRFDEDIPVFDVPIEVTRRVRKKRKKASDSSSVVSTKSGDRTPTKNAMCGSDNHGDIRLSDPLIGFDPHVENDASTSKSSLLSSRSSVSDEGAVVATSATENCGNSSDSVNSSVKSNECNNELTSLSINSLNTECVISCQDSIIVNSNIDVLPVPSYLLETAIPHDFPKAMEEAFDSILADNELDSNENTVKAQADTVNSDDNSKDETMTADTPTSVAEPSTVSKAKKNAENTIIHKLEEIIRERRESLNSHESTVDSESGSQLSTPPRSIYGPKKITSDTSLVKVGQTSLRSTQSDSEFTGSEIEEKENLSDVKLMSPEQRKNMRKIEGSRRYQSESEKLLEDLTKLEVERLRAEIKSKLQPSREKLEKVRQSIADKSSGSEKDSSFQDKGDSATSSSTQPLFDDSSDDATEHDASSINQDSDINSKHKDPDLRSNSASSLSSSFPVVKVSRPIKDVENHKAVANIDHTLKLYLMLEILEDENEDIMKLFHVSTGHSEGNWTALYLMFTDSHVYFLRSGDGNCPYQREHVVSYEDMDYASVGYNDQKIEFVFYKKKAKPAKSNKSVRTKSRAKVLVDSGDKDLTDLMISTLSRAVTVYTRRFGVTKVCPPVFHDAREHQISLVKYLRSEGLTGDIQFYQLVHWEDPDFVTGANVSKVSMEGTLKHKIRSLWGSTTKTAYFVLNGGILYQYTSRDSQKPDLSYELTGGNCIGCRRVRATGSSADSGLEFEINFADESNLALIGFSDIEVTEWLQCLCMVVSLDQTSTVDQQAASDGIIMNMLNHDALVPCSLIIADETVLLCHEDQHTGFCRTLAKAPRQDISTVNIDGGESCVCELVVPKQSELPQTAKWGVFFPEQAPLRSFISKVNSFSKAPSLCEKKNNSGLSHYQEARILLDSRWTRTDNLLKGRTGGSESYTFI